jgi:hypothetical protein
MRETSQSSYGAPDDQDARNPDAGADSVQQQITRDLEQEVAKKENTADQSELLAGDSQVLIHRQGGKSDVGAIEVANEVKHKDKRDDLPLYLLNRSGFDGCPIGSCFVSSEHLPSIPAFARISAVRLARRSAHLFMVLY